MSNETIAILMFMLCVVVVIRLYQVDNEIEKMRRDISQLWSMRG